MSSGLHFMNFPGQMALLPTAQHIGTGSGSGGGGGDQGHMGFLASLGGHRPITALSERTVAETGLGGGSSNRSSNGGGGGGGGDDTMMTTSTA
ncbi:hypothetical protein QJS10_CPB21g00671 [Acorus calamus]|uniref:Uncharacterized protein n=1 Tax=Acorus calamus TaxID=4465 RepID=A0AAV9C8C8_ACOCL|nr:hypothetical protein QJS10_CPB21g00671 [Acorus calamus]